MKGNTPLFIIDSGLGGLSSGDRLEAVYNALRVMVQSLKQVCISSGVPHKGKH